MPKFTYTVTVHTDTAERAEQVMMERIMHDEWYGFDYTVNFSN